MTTTWEDLEKPGVGTGFGWDLNEANLCLNQVEDVDTSLTVYLNSLGLASVWTDVTKP